jgi:hypothetical protein
MASDNMMNLVAAISGQMSARIAAKKARDEKRRSLALLNIERQIEAINEAINQNLACGDYSLDGELSKERSSLKRRLTRLNQGLDSSKVAICPLIRRAVGLGGQVLLIIETNQVE